MFAPPPHSWSASASITAFAICLATHPSGSCMSMAPSSKRGMASMSGVRSDKISVAVYVLSRNLLLWSFRILGRRPFFVKRTLGAPLYQHFRRDPCLPFGNSSMRPPCASSRLDTETFQEKSARLLPRSSSAWPYFSILQRE